MEVPKSSEMFIWLRPYSLSACWCVSLSLSVCILVKQLNLAANRFRSLISQCRYGGSHLRCRDDEFSASSNKRK